MMKELIAVMMDCLMIVRLPVELELEGFRELGLAAAAPVFIRHPPGQNLENPLNLASATP